MIPQTIFYGDYSAFSIKVSVVKCNIQLKIAPTLDGQRKQGKPSPGEKIYAWDDDGRCAFFSIMPQECASIFYNLDAIMSGKYVNPKEQDPERAKSFVITHFLENKPSRLIIFPPKRESQLQVSISRAGNQMVSFVLRQVEIPIFKGFIMNGFQNLPYHCALIDGFNRYKSFEQFESKNNQPSNGNSYKYTEEYYNNPVRDSSQSPTIPYKYSPQDTRQESKQYSSTNTHQSSNNSKHNNQQLPPLDDSFNLSNGSEDHRSEVNQSTSTSIDGIDFGF